MHPYAVYLVIALSFFAFYLYWRDKRAAKLGEWRVSEQTLHIVALMGGWPGALIAQKVFRHKTRKQSFQIVFWFTVVVNIALLVWFMTPEGEALLLDFIQQHQKPKTHIEWTN